ncbi:hypothetical protein E2C01_058195 [Portunus trituberculatus]|uniref:Uncharacterized protein n=1 Tax=Portunus trituberculatus TaxID=210409 RepID=A0A5B7H334_PORTR|nr:hypothetical protein [Portunus trituberculatus]
MRSFLAFNPSVRGKEEKKWRKNGITSTLPQPSPNQIPEYKMNNAAHQSYLRIQRARAWEPIKTRQTTYSRLSANQVRPTESRIHYVIFLTFLLVYI